MIILLLKSLATDVSQAVSSSCETDNTAAIISGVVVAVISVALILAVTVIVIVTLVLRSRSGNYSTSTAKTRLFEVLYFTHVIGVFTEVQLVLQTNH